MDKELQDYYENRFELTASKGWNDLMEDIDKMVKTVSDIRFVSDDKAPLHFRRGQLDILLWLKELRSQAEVAYKQLQEEDANGSSV